MSIKNDWLESFATCIVRPTVDRSTIKSPLKAAPYVSEEPSFGGERRIIEETADSPEQGDQAALSPQPLGPSV
jgi:hypothetical protein